MSARPLRRAITADKGTVLKLYVTGATPHSLLAVKNIKAICEKYLPSAYRLDIIDVYQQPELAKKVGIIATPTLIRAKPGPPRILIGDLSDAAKVIRTLELDRL